MKDVDDGGVKLGEKPIFKLADNPKAKSNLWLKKILRSCTDKKAVIVESKDKMEEKGKGL